MGHRLGDISLWSNVLVSWDYDTFVTPSLHFGFLFLGRKLRFSVCMCNKRHFQPQSCWVALWHFCTATTILILCDGDSQITLILLRALHLDISERICPDSSNGAAESKKTQHHSFLHYASFPGCRLSTTLAKSYSELIPCSSI